MKPALGCFLSVCSCSQTSTGGKKNSSLWSAKPIQPGSGPQVLHLPLPTHSVCTERERPVHYPIVQPLYFPRFSNASTEPNQRERENDGGGGGGFSSNRSDVGTSSACFEIPSHPIITSSSTTSTSHPRPSVPEETRRKFYNLTIRILFMFQPFFTVAGCLPIKQSVATNTAIGI